MGALPILSPWVSSSIDPPESSLPFSRSKTAHLKFQWPEGECNRQALISTEATTAVAGVYFLTFFLDWFRRFHTTNASVFSNPNPTKISRCVFLQSLVKSSWESRDRPTIIPQGVPYMVKLLRYYVSEDAVYLHLEHVKGELPTAALFLNWPR